LKFRKYSSIENHYRTEFIERIRLEGLDEGDWVATEKVHGANFSIWVNATRTKIAKRSGLLGDGTGFFNVYHIAHELKAKGRACFNLIKKDYPNIKAVAIYGELCGGCYPHPKVTPNPRFKKVQQGIWYSPTLQFLVFDIKLIYNASIDEDFLDWFEMASYANFSCFHTVPLIGHGTFDAMMELRNDYSSVVHKWWSLPKIKGNIMEGLVIRPSSNKYMARGERVMIKSKNAKWSEKVERKVKKPIKLKGICKRMVKMALPMVNANRYASIVSKIGDVTPKHFSQILGLMIQDIHSEIIDEDPKLYMQFQELDNETKKLVHRVLAPEVAVIIREELLGIKRSK
jgi:Rnl2 family RNA ligase